MINPDDYPPGRIPDNHAATSAVFKTPFVADLPFSGVWDSTLARTVPIVDPADPTDGFSEVILVPGSTDCYFYSHGSAAVIWAASTNQDFRNHLLPVLSSHPVGADIVDGTTQLVQGLRGTNLGGNNVAILPKFDAIGHAVMECRMIPVGPLVPQALNILVGFVNYGVKAASRTRAHLTIRWDTLLQETASLDISSTGDNNTMHSDFYLFQFQVPIAGAIIEAFWIAVDDVDSASHWKYSLASPTDSGFGIHLTEQSACAFAMIDAPEMGDLSETLSERTTALTGLLTYMGSDLQNGGQIAAARLGMGLSPLRSPRGDVYTYLASLPFYNDDFRLQDGIYCWWLPDSVQELFYAPYRNPRSDDLEENAVLQFAMHRDNPNQGVRLKVVQNLEVITRSRLYTSESGPNNPAYSSIVAAVKSVPAVTINSAHLGILGRALRAVKTWVSKPTNWRKLLVGGAGVIQKLAPGSAPASIASSIAQRFA
jgi:hypothetical protein